jgi:iron(III) transport system substrate-binding protein
MSQPAAPASDHSAAQRTSPRILRLVKALWLSITTVAAVTPAASSEVTLYSYREPQRIEPLLRAFHGTTGITVKTIYAREGLIERIEAEGAASPADVLLTNEFGLLLDARARGITHAFRSEVLEANVHPIYRDPEGHWFGLTQRARLFVVSAKRVDSATIAYEDLVRPRWKGKICMRSGKHPYNVALIASMLAHHGARETEAWLRGVRNNLARKPSGGDRDQIKAVIEGVCDLAIVNSYYAANFFYIDQSARELKHDSIHVVFPNAAGRGTHVAISGAALMKHSRNKEGGIRLIELLSSAIGQRIYSAINDEYPVNEAAPAPSVMEIWPPLKPDALPLHKIGELRRDALGLVESIGFDQGPNSPPLR